jgi:hypothetical protein
VCHDLSQVRSLTALFCDGGSHPPFLFLFLFLSSIRLLALSVDGKLHTVLRTLARAVRFHIEHRGVYRAAGRMKDNGWKSIPLAPRQDQAMRPCAVEGAKQEAVDVEQRRRWWRTRRRRRAHPVRRLVRDLVLKYPLVLGTSMNRISERLEAMQTWQYPGALQRRPMNVSDEESERRRWWTEMEEVVDDDVIDRWSTDFLTILRRSESAHSKWLRLQEAED